METATKETEVLVSVNDIVDSAMSTRKGVNVELEWERSCKTRKTCTDEIRKRTSSVGRVGIDYSNQKIVKAMRESGELPSEEQPIWNGKGEWVIFPYLFRHTVTNSLYMRLYTGTSKTLKPQVQYFRNGVPCDYQDVENDLLASEKGKSLPTNTFCVKIEDMIRIGKTEEVFVEDEQEVFAEA